MDLSVLFPDFASVSVVEVGRAAEPVAGEAALVAGAAERRRRTFAAGREAAHRALRALGAPDEPILQAPGGAPLWPEGCVGSIAHTGRYAAAVVARRRDAEAVGIDLEVVANVREELARYILTDSEFDAWTRRAADRDTAELAIRFSAKEAAIKCLGGADRPPPGLRTMEVALDGPRGTFRIRLADGTDGASALEGRHFIDRSSGHVVAGIVRRAPPG